jgi:hypothetical protein
MLFIAHQQGHTVSVQAEVVETHFTSRWFLRVLMVLVR